MNYGGNFYLNEVIKQFVKFLAVLPMTALIIIVLVINCRLYYSPEVRIDEGQKVNVDLLNQLQGLKSSLGNHADRDMQQLFPEGFIFMNALYGLAWCNVIEDADRQSRIFLEGSEEIQKSLSKINSDEGRAPFYESLPLSHGAFYTGWSSYLLGKKLSLEKIEDHDPEEAERFKKQCEKIALAIEENVFPESYKGGAWPADAIVCVATLVMHDKIFTPLYDSTVHGWVEKVKTLLDTHGLIPHSINPSDNKTIEGARGSSQSLMLIFLNEIDKGFAEKQFQIYYENFVDQKMGLMGIREYPKGYPGDGDIDSGPVILQMGASATLAGMQTLNLYHKIEEGTAIRKGIEAIGFPTNQAHSKSYLFGLMPMADTFIAWSDSSVETENTEHPFLMFHLYSVTLITSTILLCWAILRLTRKKYSS